MRRLSDVRNTICWTPSPNRYRRRQPIERNRRPPSQAAWSCWGQPSSPFSFLRRQRLVCPRGQSRKDDRGRASFDRSAALRQSVGRSGPRLPRRRPDDQSRASLRRNLRDIRDCAQYGLHLQGQIGRRQGDRQGLGSTPRTGRLRSILRGPSQKSMPSSPHERGLDNMFHGKSHAYFSLKRYDQAIDWARRAIAVGQSNPRPHATLAGHWRAGHEGEARDALQQYLALPSRGQFRTIAALKACLRRAIQKRQSARPRS